MRESAAASAVWRHLTHPDGMTVSLLVTAAGLLRRHAAEFEGVQRRLQINQYR